MRPRVIACLGATAAQSLLGTAFRVSAHRGEVLPLPAAVETRVAPEPVLLVTVHPSSVLRDRSDRREEAYESFVDDLRGARSASAST